MTRKRLMIPLFILILLITVVSASAGVTEDLILYNTFEPLDRSGATAIDLSGQENLTVNNGQYLKGSPYGVGLNLSADQWAKATNTAFFNNGNFTVSFWYQPEGSFGSATKTFFHTNNNGFYLLEHTTPKWYGYFNGTLCDNIYPAAPGWYVANQTNHITLVADGTNSNLSIYINGTYDTSVSCSIQNTTDTNLHIGVNTDESSDPAKGIIDELMIYNRTLSQAEIINLTNLNNPYLTAPRIVIQGYEKLGQSTINSFSISLNGTYNGNTTNGTYHLQGLSLGTQALMFNNTNYALAYANVSISKNVTYYNFSLFTTNSLNVTFKDEINLSVVLKNISIDFISAGQSINTSTTNGSIYVDLLTPEVYTVRYEADGYPMRLAFVQVINTTSQDLQFFMLQNASSETVTITVIDEISNEVEGAYVLAQRYYVGTNTFVTTAACKTNNEGQCTMDLETVNTGGEFYKFIVRYPFSTIKKVTASQQVHSTSLNIQITLGETVAEQFFIEQYMANSLGFNNETNAFILTYDDPTSSIHEMCLKVYSVGLGSESLYNSSCLTATSGTIILTVENKTNAVYRADALGSFSPTLTFLLSLRHAFEESNVAGRYGLLLAIMMISIFVFIGYFSMVVALIIVPIPLLIFSIMNLIDLGIAFVGIIWVVCIIIALVIGAKIGK